MSDAVIVGEIESLCGVPGPTDSVEAAASFKLKSPPGSPTNCRASDRKQLSHNTARARKQSDGHRHLFHDILLGDRFGEPTSRGQSQPVLYIISVLLSRYYVINFMLLLGGCCGRNAGSHLDNSNENGQMNNGS